MRKLDIVDETLKELGTTTDYQKLDTKMRRFVVGWFVIISLWNLGEIVWWQKIYDVLTALWITFLVNYSNHTNLIGDLKFAYILGCVFFYAKDIRDMQKFIGYFSSYFFSLRTSLGDEIIVHDACSIKLSFKK